MEIKIENLPFANLENLSNKELTLLIKTFESDSLRDILRKLLNGQLALVASEMIITAERDFDQINKKALKALGQSEVVEFLLNIHEAAQKILEDKAREDSIQSEDMPVGGI